MALFVGLDKEFVELFVRSPAHKLAQASGTTCATSRFTVIALFVKQHWQDLKVIPLNAQPV